MDLVMANLSLEGASLRLHIKRFQPSRSFAKAVQGPSLLLRTRHLINIIDQSIPQKKMRKFANA